MLARLAKIKYKSRGKKNQIEESTMNLKGKKAISLKQSYPIELCATSLILAYLSFDKKSANTRISQIIEKAYKNRRKALSCMHEVYISRLSLQRIFEFTIRCQSQKTSALI